MQELPSNILMIAEKDAEGKPYGFSFLNKAHVIFATFNAYNCTLVIIMTSQTSTTQTETVPLLNKQGEKTKSHTQGLTSMTSNQRFQWADRELIVQVSNWLSDKSYTVDDFPGFTLHEEIKIEMEAMRLKKEAEEQEALYRPHLEAENRYRRSVNQIELTMEEFITMYQVDPNGQGYSKKEVTNEQSGQTEGTEGTEVPGGEGRYISGVDPNESASNEGGARILSLDDASRQESGEIIAEYQGRPAQDSGEEEL